MLDAPDPMPDTRTLETRPMEWQGPAMPVKCITSLFDASSNAFLTNEEHQPQENDSSCPEKSFPAKMDATTTALAVVIGYASEQSKNSDNSSTEILEITSSPQPATLKPLLPPTTTATVTNTTATAAATAAPTIRHPPSSRLVDSSWPQAMVSTHFFGSCANHQGQRKNELNFFCLGCGPSGGDGALMCQYCAQEHTTQCDGACIQLYRYMYHDIVRVSAVNHLFDLSGIQQYRANGHPAVHLRPMGPPANKSPYSSVCDGGCGRCLDPLWAYCSLSCKLGLTEEGANFHNNTCGGVMAYVTSSCGGGGGGGNLLKKGEKRTTKHHGSVTNLAGVTASNSEEDEEYYYHHRHHYSNATTHRAHGSSGGGGYRRALMVSLKGAKRRKSIYPVRSDSL